MSSPLRSLTPAERVDQLAARGIMLYAVGLSLRARYAPESAALVEAARPALAKHRTAIVDYLCGLGEGRPRTSRVERVEDARNLGSNRLMPVPKSPCTFGSCARSTGVSLPELGEHLRTRARVHPAFSRGK